MSDIIRIAIDAMGGDNAPAEIVKGAVQAAGEVEDVCLILVGPEETIRSELESCGYTGDRIEVRNATQVITNDETPVMAIRTKTDSTLVVGANMVAKGEADALMSAGSTGAVLAAGTFLIGRLPGVLRSPLGVLVPNKDGVSLFLDGGANVDSKPEQLLQYAKMGKAYMESVMQVKNPSIGLLNIGTEEEKGNQLTKSAHALLKEEQGLNFIGNVEARALAQGGADVIVADAFAGNVALKAYEGVSSMLLSEIKKVMKSSFLTMIGAALIKNPLKARLSTFDAKSHGGAPLLGLKHLVVKAHGNSTAVEIRNTVAQCRTFVQGKTTEKLKELL